MKSFQERVLKDFDVKQEVQKNGHIKNVYVYVGKYASWGKEGEELSRYKRIHLWGGILMVICLVWAAFQKIPMNAFNWTGALTLLSFAALLAFGMGIIQFVCSKKRMYVRDCKIIRELVLWGGMIYFLLQLADVIAGTVYLIRHESSVLSVMAVLAYALSAFLAFVIFMVQKKLGYRELEAVCSREGK